MEQNNPAISHCAALAKVNRPWLPTAFPRQRLFQRLDELAERPCTWIGAPAGYGKTMLAASYVEIRGIPSLWYQASTKTTPIRRLSFTASELPSPRSGTGLPLPLLTPEYQDNLPTFTRRYAQILGQRLRPPFMLLFDNYHRLPTVTPLHAVWGGTARPAPRCGIRSDRRRGEPPPALKRARLARNW